MANFRDHSFWVFGDYVYTKNFQINRLFDYLYNYHKFLLREVIGLLTFIYLKERMFS